MSTNLTYRRPEMQDFATEEEFEEALSLFIDETLRVSVSRSERYEYDYECEPALFGFAN